MKDCGIAAQGATRKSDFIAHIGSHLTCMSRLTHVNHVLAIDVGITNVGHALIRFKQQNSTDNNDKLLAWGVDAVDDLNCPYDPARLAGNLEKFLHAALTARNIDFHNVHVVIERQQWRPMTCTSQSIVRCAAMEAMLFGMASSRGIAKSVSAARVAEWHNVELKGSMKKKAAVSRVIQLLSEGTTISVPFELRERFRLEKKRDDMADAFLIGTAFSEWRNNTAKLSTQYPEFDVRETPPSPKPVASVQLLKPNLTASASANRTGFVDKYPKLSHRTDTTTSATTQPANIPAHQSLKGEKNSELPTNTNLLSKIYADAFISEYINSEHTSYKECAKAVNSKFLHFPFDEETYKVNIAIQEFNRRLAYAIPGYRGVLIEPIASARYSLPSMMSALFRGIRLLDPLSTIDLFSPEGELQVPKQNTRQQGRWLWNYCKSQFLKAPKSLSVVSECNWRARSDIPCSVDVGEVWGSVSDAKLLSKVDYPKAVCGIEDDGSPTLPK
ncbi:UNVERIFIED_CONTAM: hypothetical protein HDU68_002495 [Siphonaria sp. JEL0065]|nr:hypothetical protein HDU68_002495 [Siphonaria sp. JEL0065]